MGFIQTLEEVKQATVAILTQKKKIMGTGIVVSKNGFVLTCWHVFEDCQEIKEEFQGQFQDVLIRLNINHDIVDLSAKLIFPNLNNKKSLEKAVKFDLALLQILEPEKHSIIDLPFCKLGPPPTNLKPPNEKIRVISYWKTDLFPKGDTLRREIIDPLLFYYLSDDQKERLQRWKVSIKGRYGIKLDEYVAEGTSGGPVFHIQTEYVIGLVNASTPKNPESLSFAIPFRDITEFLNEADEEISVGVRQQLETELFRKHLLNLCDNKLKEKLLKRKISSYKDFGYSPAEFFTREQYKTSEYFEEFLKQNKYLIFVIGGKVGTGKTWEIGHLIEMILTKKLNLEGRLFVFYVPGWEDLERELKNISIDDLELFGRDLTINALDITLGKEKVIEKLGENSSKLTIIIVDGLDEAETSSLREKNLEFIQKLLSKKVKIVISVRTFVWKSLMRKKFSAVNTKVWIHPSPQNLQYKISKSRFSIILNFFDPEEELPEVIKKHNLPVKENWSRDLWNLATKPYWLRIIREEYLDWSHLPSSRSIRLIRKYFERMELIILSLPEEAYNYLKNFVNLWFEKADPYNLFQLDYNQVIDKIESNPEILSKFATLGFLELDMVENSVTILEETVALYLYIYHFSIPHEFLLGNQNFIIRLPDNHKLTCLSLIGQLKPNDQLLILNRTLQELNAIHWQSTLENDWRIAVEEVETPTSIIAGIRVRLEDAKVLKLIQKSHFQIIDTNEDYSINTLRIQASGHYLSSLLNIIKKLEKLRKLDLSSNSLDFLPETIKGLKNLEYLNLNYNQLSRLPESFKYLHKLKILYSKNNLLQGLPESFGKLKKLQDLHLENNQLQSLPESFKYLYKLKNLYLQHNKLQSLPKSFGYKPKLENLHLENNQLIDLPLSFGYLPMLKFLHLENNLLQALPESFGKLKKLQDLHLENNQLQALPEFFGKLCNLILLDLRCNRLQALLKSFKQLSKLQYLYLDDNRLSTLPESLGHIPKLEYLFLSKNKIRVLPESLGNLCKLKILNLQHNNFESLPESIGQLSKLEFLDLKSSQLLILPEYIVKLQNLKLLTLNENQITFNMDIIKVLQDRGCKIVTEKEL